MLKYIFFPTTRDLWRELATRLHAQGVASPVLWIGHRRHDEFARENFPECTVMNFNEINKGIACFPDTGKQDSSKAPEMLGEAWFPAFKDQVIRMFDRKDYFGAFRSVDREAIFYQLVFRLHSLIFNEKPDFLLMAESPHSAATLVVYRICEHLKIPVICYMSSSIAPALFVKGGIEKPPIKLPLEADQVHFKREAALAVDRMIENLATSEQRPQQPKYMFNQQKKERRRRIGRPFKMLREVIRGLLTPLLPDSMRARTYHAFHGFSSFASNPGPVSEILKYVTEIKAQRALIKAYSVRSILEEDFPPKYVFFPLHYEPERTSNPDGGEWNNQYHALARLRQLLPDDVAIVVKEHPSQLGSVLQGFRGRSRLFYEAISTIGYTVLAQIDIPSWKIQQSALFTCTITGTAALEAAIIGKPVLLMGHPWFRGCPGITPINETVSINEVLGNTANIEDVRSFLYHLIEEYSVFGVVNPSSERYFSSWFKDSASRNREEDGVVEATLLAIQDLVQGKDG